ncbi:glycosyltransferase involved in cell wall biosynthesis [Azospirillum fermentarium]|uniref:glycosyltransferase family 2 protein n=1 Tax=Azospirillum fermentarium TaxID=1233114 RepID=UPI002226A12B|nr:glycosyltransferase family 2 protein [Azospirillum fermentarium]MCW2249606.1 glycosyltransferase involved in cell wall biosynthesis [Azospirillum fermentarium]
MAHAMKISIVTISYNQAEFLERAMRSVLEQDYPNIEYIVVDPGSVDGSRALIGRYGHRLSRVILDPDNGPADGLNHGLAVATGEVFAFLNADDYLLPGAVGAIMAGFRAHPDSDVLYGHGSIVDLRHGRSRRVLATAPITPWRLAHGGVFLLQQASFYRTDAVRAVGGFNAANRTCWDGELIAELLLAGRRFRLLPADLAVFTLHAQSISGTGALEDRYHADWTRICQRLTGRGPDWLDPARRLAARSLKWAGNPRALAVRLGWGWS